MPRYRKTKTRNDEAVIEVAGHQVIVDLCMVEMLNDYSLSFVRNETTAFVQATSRDKTQYIRLSRLVMDPPAHKVVDHINGNPLDNRRRNLRIVTSRQNAQNRAKRGDRCTSKYKGVCLKGGRWFACLYQNYRQVSLGFFPTEREAAEAYDAEARSRFGRCAALNFPKAGEQSAHRPRTITFHAAEVVEQ
ncbi:MAG: hypothetical protein CMN25_07425 [Salinicola sp.]|nr:hypothetical protein [Salinicola sp.]